MSIDEILSGMQKMMKEQEAIYHRVASGFGFSDTAHWILYMLYYSKEAITQYDLRTQGDFPKQTVNTAIASLVRDELIELKQTDENRKTKRILLTEKGIEAARCVVVPLREAEWRAMQRLSEDELQSLMRLSVKLIGALREETEKIIKAN